MIPVLEWSIAGDELSYRWAEVVDGFDMPVHISLGATAARLIPTQAWQTIPVPSGTAAIEVDHDYYVISRRVDGAAR